MVRKPAPEQNSAIHALEVTRQRFRNISAAVNICNAVDSVLQHLLPFRNAFFHLANSRSVGMMCPAALQSLRFFGRRGDPLQHLLLLQRLPFSYNASFHLATLLSNTYSFRCNVLSLLTIPPSILQRLLPSENAPFHLAICISYK